MTKEEAIKEINKVFTPAYANYIVTALTEGATISDKSICATKNDLEVDCISRKDALDSIAIMCSAEELDIDFAKLLLLRREIKKIPSVTPSACIAKISYDNDKLKELVDEVASKYQTKVARWIKETSVYGWDGHSYQCSECGRSIHLDTELEDLSDYPYCHCGCIMEDENEGTS